MIKEKVHHSTYDQINFNLKGLYGVFFCKWDENLFEHTKTQQFKLFVRDDKWPVLQYKQLSGYVEWLPDEGILM